MTLALINLYGWRPYMRQETWKQIFQKYEESIPGSLRRTILDKCENIETVLLLKTFHVSVLRTRYEDFGKEVLSSTDIIDWENVAEHLGQMYDECERAVEYERQISWIRKQERQMSRICKEELLSHMTMAVLIRNLRENEEPKRKIRIKVKNLKGSEYVFEEMTTHDLILSLKRKIASKVGNMTEDEIILLHGETELCDNDTLETYGITEGETVFMLQRSRGKGLIETARNLYSEALNVLKYLGEWVPGLFADSTRAITLKEICKISQAIGKNWQLIGPLLGLDVVQMDHNNEDNRDSTLMKIKSMLETWLNENQSKATVGRLYQALKECKNVTINWTKIKNIFSDHDAVFLQG